MSLSLHLNKELNEHLQFHIISGGGHKVTSKDSKPRNRCKMTETERGNKKRKKEKLQQESKSNFSQLFSNKADEKQTKGASSSEDETIGKSNLDR